MLYLEFILHDYREGNKQNLSFYGQGSEEKCLPQGHDLFYWELVEVPIAEPLLWNIDYGGLDWKTEGIQDLYYLVSLLLYLLVFTQ